MLKKKVFKGLLGVSAVAALFGALAVQAQTSQGTATQSTTGQQGTGTSGTSGTAGTSGQSGTSGAPGTSATATGGATTGTGAAAGKLSKADQKIVTDMARANMAEIEAGKLAQSKSQNEQVKNYAQQMIDDHTKALTELQQLAQAKGATMPTDLDMRHKAMATKLGAMSGEAFDKAYMAQAGVSDHKKVHSMLKQHQARAKDPELKALAAKLLPTVDQHLNAATQMQGTKGGKQGAADTTGTTSSGKTTQ